MDYLRNEITGPLIGGAEQSDGQKTTNDDV